MQWAVKERERVYLIINGKEVSEVKFSSLTPLFGKNRSKLTLIAALPF